MACLRWAAQPMKGLMSLACSVCATSSILCYRRDEDMYARMHPFLNLSIAQAKAIMKLRKGCSIDKLGSRTPSRPAGACTIYLNAACYGESC